MAVLTVLTGFCLDSAALRRDYIIGAALGLTAAEETEMNAWIVVALTLFAPIGALAQSADSSLSTELQQLHSEWFAAFDAGDGATMDRIEVENLVIVLPNGVPWTKDGPRAGEQPKRDPPFKASLSEVTVRQFGDTAVLTGTLTSSGATGSDKVGTTVVFVKQAGRWLIASAQWTPLQAPKQ